MRRMVVMSGRGWQIPLIRTSTAVTRRVRTGGCRRSGWWIAWAVPVFVPFLFKGHFVGEN